MKLRSIAASVVLAMTTTLAWAGGDHAGGHGHGDHGKDSAIGMPGKAAKVTRTVEVAMTDNMRFSPSSVNVKQGETIRFNIKNSGQVKHEFVLGTDKELKEHYQVMLKNPEMEHDDPNMVTLAAGKSGEVIWQFTKTGKVDFACLQPGHYDAGMKGAVTVDKTTGATTGKAANAGTGAQDGHSAHKH